MTLSHLLATMLAYCVANIVIRCIHNGIRRSEDKPPIGDLTGETLAVMVFTAVLWWTWL